MIGNCNIWRIVSHDYAGGALGPDPVAFPVTSPRASFFHLPGSATHYPLIPAVSEPEMSEPANGPKSEVWK